MTITLNLELTEKQYERVCNLVQQMQFAVWKTPEKMLGDLLGVWIPTALNRKMRLWERKCRGMLRDKSALEVESAG